MSRTKLLPFILSLGVLLTPVLANSQQPGDMDTLKSQLIGSYSLVFYNGIDENGNTVRQPYSVGRISYDSVGRMTAQLMADGGPGAGFISYFGAYSIDTARQAVIHHVEGTNIENLLGQSLVRYLEFSADGSSLFLETRNGDRVTGRLRWDRITAED